MTTLFVMQIENIIDLITNSSSELFVLRSKEKGIMIELLDHVYRDWRNEYEEPKNISELTVRELDDFVIYATGANCWPTHRKSQYQLLPGFSFDELYEIKEKAWNGRFQYQLKNNLKSSEHEWQRSFVTEENFEEIKNRLSPDEDMWFLFSIDENPDYEGQDLLCEIAEKYHLG